MAIEAKKTSKTAGKAASLKKETKAVSGTPIEEVSKTIPAVVGKPEEAKKTGKTSSVSKKAANSKKGPKTSVVIEYEGKQIPAEHVISEAEKAFARANKGVEIKTIDVYVKPEEHAAYYVVNGIGSDDYKLML